MTKYPMGGGEEMFHCRGTNVLVVATFFAMLAVSSVPVSASIGAPITCPLSTQPVTIDGKWTSPTEWTDAPEIQMLVGAGNGIGYFRMKHDATNLYILGESLVDTAVEYNSTAGGGDFMSVFLDTLYNQGSAPQTGDYKLLAEYMGAGNTTIRAWEGNGTGWVKVSSIQGVQGAVGLDTGNSPHPPHPHAVFEMSIPLSLIPASTFGFFIRLDESNYWWASDQAILLTHFYWPGPTPANQGFDPSSWGTVTISNTPIQESSSSPLSVTLAIFSVVVFARVQGKNRHD
jgi:hypothetical protein